MLNLKEVRLRLHADGPKTLTVSKTLVEVGELSGDRIEIQSGLSNGDQIAISGVHHLSEGMQVLRYEN